QHGAAVGMQALVGLTHAASEQAGDGFARSGCPGPTGEVGEVPAVGAGRVRRASLLPALNQALCVRSAHRKLSGTGKWDKRVHGTTVDGRRRVKVVDRWPPS